MQVVAQKGPSRHRLMFGAGFFLACLAVGAVAATVLPAQMVKMVPTVAFMLGFGGFAVAAMSGMFGRTVRVVVGDGALRLADSPGDTWSLRGATTGRLHTLQGMASGTVVHLLDGPRSLRVASMGHRLVDETQVTAPPVTMADLYVAPNELDALRAFAHAGIAQPRPGDVQRFRLVTNPATARGLVTVLVPFVGGLVVLGIAAQVSEGFGMFDSLAEQAVFGLSGLVVMAGLVAWNIVRRSRGEHGVVLELGPSGVRLSDVSGARVIGQAQRQQLTITRATHRYHSRSGSFDYPGITLAWPGQAPLSIGVVALHLRWADVGPSGPAPRYVLGIPDWCALVEAVGMRSYLSGV